MQYLVGCDDYVGMRNEILSRSYEASLKILENSRCANMPFHGPAHTLEVFRNTKLIADNLNIPEDKLLILQVSALFHDTGNAESCKGHEEISCQMAKDFLKEQEQSPRFIADVLGCIRATKMPQQPKNILQKIVCDADLFHLGDPVGFPKRLELLRTEWADMFDLQFDEQEWLTINCSFLETHRFHTSYGNSVLEKGKQQNLLALKAKLHALVGSTVVK